MGFKISFYAKFQGGSLKSERFGDLYEVRNLLQKDQVLELSYKKMKHACCTSILRTHTVHSQALYVGYSIWQVH